MFVLQDGSRQSPSGPLLLRDTSFTVVLFGITFIYVLNFLLLSLFPDLELFGLSDLD
jgi:hypothetical protein